MKILVPTDFTEISEYGLKVARDIAIKNQAEIYLVNYIQPIADDFKATGDTTLPNFEEQAFIIELTKKNSQLIHDLALKYGNEVTIKPVIEVDYFESAMEHFIKEKEIDLVVMGTSGERSYDELVFGNHTEKIIRISSCPVLSIKHYYSAFNPKSLVLAVDLETEGSVELSYFKNFAQLFDATVHFVHVVKNKKKITPELTAQLEKEAQTFGFVSYTTSIIVGSNKEETLEGFAKQKKADLIGITTRAKNGLINLFMGSLAGDLVKENETPALTMTVNMDKSN